MITNYEKVRIQSTLINADAGEAICRLSELREEIEKVYPRLYEPGDGDQIRDLISKVRSAIASMADRAQACSTIVSMMEERGTLQ